jgi:hypothetical protein
MPLTNWVWITWERQRRSQVLSEYFGCEFHEIVYEGPLRYPRSIAGTLSVLAHSKPAGIIVQNPSMVLAFVAVLWGRLTRTPVVVDRHTTFQLNRAYRLSPRDATFRLLSRLTLRAADLTIVTNDYLAEIVRRHGGRPFILQDKLPSMVDSGAHWAPPPHTRTIFLISSFGDDEPLEAVLGAIELVKGRNVHLYVSGNLKNAPPHLVRAAPVNVTFTGYLPDGDFTALLKGVDAVMVLTTADYTMLCGCYEAVAAEQALITSGTSVLRDYFQGAIFVDNTPESIAAAVGLPDEEIAACQTRMRVLKDALRTAWHQRAEELRAMLTEEAGIATRSVPA